jgi:hypothetical protein
MPRHWPERHQVVHEALPRPTRLPMAHSVQPEWGEQRDLNP